MHTGTEFIFHKAFAWCENLQIVEFQSGLKGVASDAFDKVSWFDELNKKEEPVILGTMVYCCPKNAVRVVLPEGVEYISQRAFADCENLESVVLPHTLAGIGDYAFSNCAALREIAFPPHMRYLGNRAFEYCERLNAVSLSGTIDRIFPEAFWSCSSLRKLIVSKDFRFHTPSFRFGRYRFVPVTGGEYPMEVFFDFAWSWSERAETKVDLNRYASGEGYYVFPEFDHRMKPGEPYITDIH